MGIRFKNIRKIIPNTNAQEMKIHVGEKASSIGTTPTKITNAKASSQKKSSQRKNSKVKNTNQSTRPFTQKQTAKKHLSTNEQNQLEEVLFHDKFDTFRLLHTKYCEEINWQEVLQEEHPFQNDLVGPNELKAMKALEAYKPTWKDNLFKRVDVQKNQLQDQIKKAREDDLHLVERWKEKKELANKILLGDISGYRKVLQDKLSTDEIFELGVAIAWDVLSPYTLVFEVDMIQEKAITTQALFHEKTASLSTRSKTKKKYYDAHQDYICSIALRLGRDGFNLLPVDNIYVHINDISENTLELGTVLSVKLERKCFATIDLDDCDCSDEIVKFQHHMHFSKIKGFQQVDKLAEEI